MSAVAKVAEGWQDLDLAAAAAMEGGAVLEHLGSTGMGLPPGLF